MNIDEIPLLTLEILKRNLDNYEDLSEEDICRYLDTCFDIKNIPALTGEAEAVTLIKEVISDNGYILGVCDYDSDGLNSGAIIHKALKHKSSNYGVIHNKRCDGNGFNPVLNKKIMDIHDKTPISLIITADHGSSCKEAFDELYEYGIKHIIITDHHTIPKDNPPENVDVFINPHRTHGDPIGMCGAYTVFKVLSGLYVDDEDIFEKLYRPCLPHVAIATVTDVMGVDIWYNRIAVRAGIQLMNADTGMWDMLSKMMSIPGSYSYKDIGFILGPFINTGNRASAEELYFSILTSEPDNPELPELIETGMRLNIARKKVRKETLGRAMLEVIPSQVDCSVCIVVDSTMAINGILANNIGEVYNVPCVCFSHVPESDTLAGSARACVGYANISEMFIEMNRLHPDLFLAYGGHSGAGGCSIKTDKLELFKMVLNDVSRKRKESWVGKSETKDIIIDISTAGLTPGVVDAINHAGPYGKGWVMPSLRGVFRIAKAIHLKGISILNLMTAGGMDVKGTYFHRDNDTVESVSDLMPRGAIIKAIFEPQYYKRNGRTDLTVVINDLTEVR